MRSKPTILLTYTNPKTHKSVQVLQAQAVYAVFYEGQPINVRSFHSLLDKTVKYAKVSFANSGHAHLLTRKLNERFKTNKFAVHRLTSGEVITR